MFYKQLLYQNIEHNIGFFSPDVEASLRFCCCTCLYCIGVYWVHLSGALYSSPSQRVGPSTQRLNPADRCLAHAREPTRAIFHSS